MDDPTADAVARMREFRSAFADQRNGANRQTAVSLARHESGREGGGRSLDRARTQVKAAFDEVVPGWRAQLSARWRAQLSATPWQQSEDAFLNMLAGEQLARLAEGSAIDTRDRADAVSLVGDTLHEWVWTAQTARRWHQGNYADAVAEAAMSVSRRVQAKAGRNDVAEAELFEELYSDQPASVSEPRLRFGDDGPLAESCRRLSARQISVGWYTAIRNGVPPSSGAQVKGHRALEYLATLSLLARWADEADVDTGDSHRAPPPPGAS